MNLLEIDAEIGSGTFIAPGVVIGKGVVIGPNCAIGTVGFGYEWDGGWRRKEHPYGVVIEDNVEIGAGTVIDRGRHRDTIIGRGTKIDAHVFIAHNVWIGQDCLIIANSMVSGSVEIGDMVHVGPQACISDHVRIGDRARVGMGAVVLKDVPDGWLVLGVPAKPVRSNSWQDDPTWGQVG